MLSQLGANSEWRERERNKKFCLREWSRQLENWRPPPVFESTVIPKMFQSIVKLGVYLFCWSYVDDDLFLLLHFFLSLCCTTFHRVTRHPLLAAAVREVILVSVCSLLSPISALFLGHDVVTRWNDWKTSLSLLFCIVLEGALYVGIDYSFL